MTSRRWRRKHSPRDPVVGEESTHHELLSCSSDDGGSSEEHGVPALLLKLRKGSIPLLVGEPIAKPGCRHRVLRPEGKGVSGCGEKEYPYQQYCCRHLEMHCYHVVAFPLQNYFAIKRGLKTTHRSCKAVCRPAGIRQPAKCYMRLQPNPPRTALTFSDIYKRSRASLCIRNPPRLVSKGMLECISLSRWSSLRARLHAVGLEVLSAPCVWRKGLAQRRDVWTLSPSCPGE